MGGFLEDGHPMVISLPDLANKNLVFDPATLNGYQETIPPYKELTI